jgi:hypothetical protein
MKRGDAFDRHTPNGRGYVTTRPSRESDKSCAIRTPIGWTPAGRPRTYRLVPGGRDQRRGTAYRRLALTVLGLDVSTLVAELSRRRGEPEPC